MQKKSATNLTPFRIAVFDALIVSVLVAGIIGSAFSVAFQVHETRQAFKTWQKSKQVRDQLDVEWGRLLIEQQTFGATTQIASRAVIYLHMYSPPANQMMTLTLPDTHDLPNSAATGSINPDTATPPAPIATPQGVTP